MNDKPLTPVEVQAAADKFFPLFSIVLKQMPKGSSTEDTLKVMETVCKLAHKERTQQELDRFGFLGNNTDMESRTTTVAPKTKQLTAISGKATLTAFNSFPF